MKIVKIMKRDFQDKKVSPNRKIVLKLLWVVGAVAIFFVIFMVLNSMTTPYRYVNSKQVSQEYTEVETSDGTYYGAVQNAVFTGVGVFQHLDGSTYTGVFSKSQRNGAGLFYWANGDTFHGTFAGDQMVEGTYTFADGRTYTGTFSGNQWADGTFTLGGAAAAIGFKEFSASISNGKIESLIFTMTNGTHYNGNLNGYAEIQYPSGDTYAGNVENGKRSGSGTFHWMSGGTVVASYNGNWEDDLMDGQGTYNYNSGDYPYVEGTFQKGLLEGKATYYKEKGKSFKTLWKNGVCVNNDVK